MSDAVDQHNASQNDEHHLRKVEAPGENHANSDYNDAHALRHQKPGGRHVHASESQDISRITFAAPIFFRYMDKISDGKHPQPKVDCSRRRGIYLGLDHSRLILKKPDCYIRAVNLIYVR